MNKNEIAILILITSLVGFVTYFAANAVLGGRTAEAPRAEYMEPISSTLQNPSKEVFNEDAINPTVPIRISNDNNNVPFGR